MSLRSKTVRRLAILLGGVLVLVAIGAGLYLRNERVKQAKLASAREAGMAAFKAGDYRATLEALKTYVSRRRDDNEALYAYGVARSKIEEPNGRNIAEGINVFTTLLQQDPYNKQAKYDLLDLYVQAFYNHEAADLADKILADSPDDLRALHAKCVALDRQRQFGEALAISEKLNQLQPDDFEQQLATYEIMRSLKSRPVEMIGRADKQLAAHPEDPRYELLAALAYGWSGDANKGKELLRQAATRPAPDATYVRYMVRVLDSQKMYRDAQQVLDRAAAQSSDPAIFRILVQRLWQARKFSQVLERLKDLNNDTGDADLVAYRAMSLFDTGKQEESRKLLAQLGQRQSDPAAVAWATALPAWFDRAEAKVALEKYRAALDRSPDNTVIRYLVGEAYARLGERELALQSWRRAAELSPSWAAPHVGAARMLLTMGRTKEAVGEAQAAYMAAPEAADANVTLAVVQYRALEQGELAAGLEPTLLELVKKIQELVPREPETLPIYVSLLARAGQKPVAIAAARGAAAADAGTSQATLLRLIAVSRAQKLGLEDELQKAITGSGAGGGGDTPRVTLARAADLAAAGRPQDGMELIDSRAGSATTQPNQWAVARLQYKEMIRDGSAAAEWVKLGDANPNDLQVQTAILKSARSARGDRDFIARTIDRVKNLTGPEGQTWKLERARWLLGSESSKDAAEAVNTLTDIVRGAPRMTEARLLLATAYENVGNTAAAAKEMQAAADLEPANAAVALETARLMQALNQFVAARQYLDRAAASTELTPDSRRRVASMLAAQGDVSQAVKMLRDAGESLDTAGKLLLAELYRSQNRVADAEAIYAKLLAAAPPEVETIRAAADFYGAQGKADQARQALARLGEAKAQPGVADLVRGQFDERYGAPGAAARDYAAATAAAPADGAAWRALIAFHLRSGRYAQALSAADEGLRATAASAGGGGDESLQKLRGICNTLADLAQQNPRWRASLAILAGSVLDDRGVDDLLINWGDRPASQPATSAAPGGTSDVLAVRLREAIDRHPRSLVLRQALVQFHVAAGELDDAAKVATATMDAFPIDPESCRIAATVYRAAKRYDLAAAAAQKWRERSPVDPQPADRAMAEIRLASGDAPGALQALGPYAKEAIAHPDANAPLLVTLLRAQVRSGRAAEAKATLQPLLPKSAKWRQVWLQLAGGEVKDADAAIAWVKQVAPLTVASDPLEQTALAGAWYEISVRTHDMDANAEARKVLEPIVKQPTAPGAAVMLRAGIAERDGDFAAAEALYRRGIKLLPDQPEALNNLAYLVFLRGGDLAEAKGYAARAVELEPATANFYDTLARIQAKQGNRDAALDTFRRAVQLDPNNLEALVGLATTLCDAGKRDSAMALLPQIDTVARTRASIPAQLRREMDNLRSAVKASL